MSDRFSLVRWRDAKTDPPEAGRVVLTDEGMARSWQGGRVWEFDLPDMEGPCNPSVWCDPSPPGDDALTDYDLRLVLGLAANDPSFHNQDAEHMGVQRAALFRLRRVIEEAER